MRRLPIKEVRPKLRIVSFQQSYWGIQWNALRPYPKVLDLKELHQRLSFDKGRFFFFFWGGEGGGGVGRSRAGAEKSNSAGHDRDIVYFVGKMW